MFAIELSTSFNTGDFDGVYNHVIFENIAIQPLLSLIEITVDWGRIESSSWYSGSTYKPKLILQIYNPDYDDIMNATSVGGLPVNEFLFDQIMALVVSENPFLDGTKVSF